MSELIDVVLPPDQVEGTRSQVQRWLKAVGEPARRHEPLVEIETDKVTVEVPSPADGVLAEIVAAEGVDVEPGAILARLRAASAADAPVAAAPVRAAPAVGRVRRARSGAARSRRTEPGHTPVACGTRPQRRPGDGQRRGRAHHRRGRAGRSSAGGRHVRRACARTRDRARRSRCARRAAYADAPAHRGAHGRKPPAYGAARDERVPVRHDGRARRSRGAQGGIRAPRPVADPDGLFRRGLRRGPARRSRGERPLERERDPASTIAWTSGSPRRSGTAGSSFRSSATPAHWTWRASRARSAHSSTRRARTR